MFESECFAGGEKAAAETRSGRYLTLSWDRENTQSPGSIRTVPRILAAAGRISDRPFLYAGEKSQNLDPYIERWKESEEGLCWNGGQLKPVAHARGSACKSGPHELVLHEPGKAGMGLGLWRARCFCSAAG